MSRAAALGVALAMIGCGGPFRWDGTMARDAAPEASDDAAPDTRATDDAAPDAHDAGADAHPGDDAAPEAAPDAMPDASPDADAACTPAATGSFTCGTNLVPVVTPQDFCHLADQTGLGASVSTPPACQCAGAYTCACVLGALTPSELCPGGTFDACGEVSGHLVVRCAP